MTIKDIVIPLLTMHAPSGILNIFSPALARVEENRSCSENLLLNFHSSRNSVAVNTYIGSFRA